MKIASRVASAILAGARLEEMIARDLHNYLEIADRLLSRPRTLARWRARTPSAGRIFDVQRWIDGWEACVRLMYDASGDGGQGRMHVMISSGAGV